MDIIVAAIVIIFCLFMVMMFGFSAGQSSRDKDLKEALRVKPEISVQEFVDAYKIEVTK